MTTTKHRRMKKVEINVDITDCITYYAWVDPRLTKEQIEEIVANDNSVMDDAEPTIDYVRINDADTKSDRIFDVIVVEDGVIDMSDLRDQDDNALIVPTTDPTVPLYGEDELSAREKNILLEQAGQQRLPFLSDVEKE